MTTTTFDSLGYFQKLKAAGMPEEQAQVQAAALRETLDKYDAASRKELATKGDIQDVRAELQEVRVELKQELADTKHEILKWVLGIALAQTAVIVVVVAVVVK